MAKNGRNDGSDQIVYGVVKVSHKGQIIIPVELRNELEIKAGDHLVVARNREGDGILLLRMEVMNEMLRSSRYST